MTTPVFGFTMMVAAIFDLVYRVSDKAYEHRLLARRFYELQKEIAPVENPTAQDFAGWQVRLLDIEKDEPPILRVLNAIMYERTMISIYGEDAPYKVHIKPYQRWFASWFDIKPDSVTITERPSNENNTHAQGPGEFEGHIP